MRLFGRQSGWKVKELVDEIHDLMILTDKISKEDGFTEEGTPAYHRFRDCEKRLVEIGNALYDKGGMKLMQKIYQRVYEEGGYTGRYLDGVWGGTKGEWMG